MSQSSIIEALERRLWKSADNLRANSNYASNEKDRVTIEQTFEELLELARSLGEEEQRAVREGLDEESLAIFDLLRKQELTREEIKEVATRLLSELKEELHRLESWQEKQATRAAVRTKIRNFLWDESTGLPVDCYTEQEVEEKAEQVYLHVFRVYDSANPDVYASA